MASVNYALKEMVCKIVYYGCGMGGKTTNLQYIHREIDKSLRGELVSLATPGERTLFFDFLPVEAPMLNGFRVKLQLYTVPGQVMYNATRKLVLRGVDGIVFVSDSQWDKMKENVESFRNMEDNLRSYGYDPDTIPYVLQYNKRDLPNIAPVEYMDWVLQQRRVPMFTSCALDGHGVFETLNSLCQFVLADLRRKQRAGAL
ncbi:gliding-motility protein MglA [candidate division KD3-62 bacterium DG_56]|uniref:Gliding-motility protein MglA n=1 Tax=candidate division KD3-62 bacterium DG_56 TaxID=1704032 RepID=A0A0S7XQL8_9BACT|nr:MAG: gliding-motility protein MglA [candidate division KD3-62 bacterium DG_56]